ncbi:NAD-dependent epimerase/dehydratase family protein [Mycetocola sp.]|uniref:NAD-dependent epimerase/dehydratase family protein n=1 Tax=Mycetocola sp. TaxID=1871042 RepID=UPI003989D9B0
MAVLVLGAGPVGSAVTRAFLDGGQDVTLGTRSGTTLPGTTAVRLDAADADTLTRAAAGRSTIVVCTNPPYHRWRTEWPPIVDAVLRAARTAGADIVLVGNLYSYGKADMPITEHTPEHPAESKGVVRRDLWSTLRAANDRGDVRAVEVRASDYFGPGATADAHLGTRFFAPILASKRSTAIGDPAQPHSWAYLPDLASTIVAAAGHAGDWGRIWLTPAASNASRTEICRQVNERYGVNGSVSGLPGWLVRGLGMVNPVLNEIAASSYQFRMPFLSDATGTERELGVTATPWETALDATVSYFRR